MAAEPQDWAHPRPKTCHWIPVISIKFPSSKLSLEFIFMLYSYLLNLANDRNSTVLPVGNVYVIKCNLNYITNNFHSRAQGPG
jgi:hypothetical protein